MLTGTGRIIAVISGAAALLVAGVFVDRELIARSPRHPNAAKSSSAAASPAPLPPGAPSGVDPNWSAPGENPTDPNSGSSSSPSTPPSSRNPSRAVSPFTATSAKTTTKIGLVDVDVDLPQVQGGKDTVAQTFNGAMRSALNGQADSLPTGKLKGDQESGVRIGKRVLSGLLKTAFTPGNATQSVAKASTVVVDTNSGSTLDVTSIFTDTNAGLKRLQTESQKLGPTTSSAGNKFSGTNLQADQTTFSHWTADTAGMRVFFAQGTVAPSSMRVVELTIPWADLKDLLKPGMLDTLPS